MNETEIPTIPESVFVHVMNLVRLDAARNIIFKLQESETLKAADKENLILILNTMWKEHDDEFHVLAKEYDDHELTEETMGDDHADEEGDTQQEKPIDFEDVR